MAPLEYLADIKSKLIASPLISSIVVIEEYTLPDPGYFRARLSLSNGDFLEVADYFVIVGESCVTRRYRYQWMDQAQQALKKRWDHVEHLPDLPSFPDHIHRGEGSRVQPGRLTSIVELIEIIKRELSPSDVP